jgi:putative membrane protein
MTLSDADRERLRQAIKDGEARSSAELVLVVADSCGGYGLFALLWPALAALLLGGILAVTASHLTAPRMFLAEAGIFVVLVAVLQWPPALLRLVPRHVRRAHAQQIAEHQFALRVHDRTKSRTGLLLLVALAERQVFVLPDAGISAAIQAASWRGVVDRLVTAIRAGPPAEAIAGAVGEIMQLLELHFPPIAGSPGALSGDVIELPAGSRGD